MSVSAITTYNESPLHAALKAWYGGPDGVYEVPVNGHVVDLVQNGLLVEVQTANFGAMRRKIEALLKEHAVRLVHPIAVEKWIVRVDSRKKQVLGRRKSPKAGSVDNLFEELVTFPALMMHPNFTLHVVLIREEEVRRNRPSGGRRRHLRKDWVREERRLIDVVDDQLFQTPADLAARIPASVPERFTTADLAEAAGVPRWLAQKMTYCLRAMEVIHVVGRSRKGICYCRSATGPQR